MEELASMDSEPQSKTKMMEILKKMHDTENPCRNPIADASNIPDEEFDILDTDLADDEGEKDSDDDESIPDLANRLEGIDLDDSEAIWHLLTDDEKKEFETLVKNDITKILPVWEPWWLFYKEKKLVSEIDENKLNDEFDYRKACPSIIENIKDFNDISKSKPAPCVKYNIVNVLSSYIYMTRLFNGDHYDLGHEAISCFILLSGNLNKGTNFENIDTALEAVIQESFTNEAFACSKTDKDQIKYDLKRVLHGPEECNKIFYIQCALSDVLSLLINFKKSASTKVTKKMDKTNNFTHKFSWNGEIQNPIPKEKYKQTVKKIEYYLSFIKNHGAETVTDLLIDLHF
ncbi:zinc finger HIT domain-containing protein 2 isoform X2 [Arctopsyche grandis]